MVICLSNIAMLHYAFALDGITPPESLYHHANDLWQVVRDFIFPDGRLARIGGDTRQRYCYCQDYILPTLLFAADHFADEDAVAMEMGALGLIQQEQAHNADGSFLSQRLQVIRETNPYYYTRLESDKAVVLSMNAFWRQIGVASAAASSSGRGLRPAPASVSSVGRGPVSRWPSSATTDGAVQARALQKTWQEPDHGAILHRSPRRLASWSWRAAEAPQGLCLPPDRSDLAEWCENLGGRVLVADEQGKRTVLSHLQSSFHGGFLTTGTMADSTKAYFAEGWIGREPVAHQLAVVALPDERTMVVLEHCRIRTRTYLREVKGLKLNIPNDLFNGFQRRYEGESGEFILDGRGDEQRTVGSRWLTVEGVLGVMGLYGAESVSLHQVGKRRASGYSDSLYYDEICFPCRTGLWDAAPGSVLLDCGSVVLSGSEATETAQVAQGVELLATDSDQVRAVMIPGADGKEYVLAVNFGDIPLYVEATLPKGTAAAVDLVNRHDWWRSGDAAGLHLPAGGASVAEIVR